MASSFNQIFRGAAGTSGDTTNVEDVFSTYLYEGNGATPTITNGIDLAGEGGLVWIKNRDATDNNVLTDTVRGATKISYSNGTHAEGTDADTITSFTSTGFVLGADVKVNTSAESYAAWTFRKAPKFFDCVTFTGDGNEPSAWINHSLGQVPGLIIIKRTDSASSWFVHHRSLGRYDNILLNSTAGEVRQLIFDSTTNGMTSTQFRIHFGGGNDANIDGASYVAYLFAHDTGSDGLIQCGSYAYDGGGSVTLGWEPQFVLLKTSSAASNWTIHDSMRGMWASERGPALYTDGNNAEASTSGFVYLNSTGFTVPADMFDPCTQIYMAIRNPMMATITDATKVFAIDGSVGATAATGFPADMMLQKDIDNSGSYDDFALTDRLRNTMWLETSSTSTETNGSIFGGWDSNTTAGNGGSNASLWGEHAWAWKRAKGFFDVVAYTGTGSAKTEAHNLGVVPEMIWIKHRSGTDNWIVGHKAFNWLGPIYLNEAYQYVGDNIAWWNNTAPTSTEFTIGTGAASNTNTGTYIAFLFATLAGVSKVGSVTHSGTSTDVACGFSAGARFVMLKRTDATGDWFVWDSVRGIVAGNDPYVLLNSTAATVTNTDYIDPLTGGFQISGDFTDGDYIFYAIA